ncbi:unnamed protein product [Mucor fragilis]
MSYQIDPLLFWLEQEPALQSKNTAIFLPADTPTDNTLNKYNYQLAKKAQIRKHRALNRLKAYELEKIALRRRMPNPKDAKPRPLVKLEAIKGDEFLASNKKELMELFEMTKQHQQGDRFVNTAIYPDSELHLEDRDHSFARALQLKNSAVIEEHEKEFHRLRSEIYNDARDLGQHSHTASPSSSPTTAPTWPTLSPPHQPKMSNRDPRSFMTDLRKPQQ